MIDPLSFSIETARPSPPRPSHPTRKLLQRIPDTNDFFLEMDYSAASMYMSCPQSAENKLIHSREAAVDSVATRFGRCFHLAEELRLRHGFTPAVTQRQHELIIKFFEENPVPLDEYRTADRLISVVHTYNKRFADPSSPLFDSWPEKVFRLNDDPFIEKPFKLPLTTISVSGLLPYSVRQLVANEGDNEHKLYVNDIHIVLTGRIDLVIREGNLLWVVDHKTSSRGGAEYVNAFRLSLQTRLYTLVLSKMLPDHHVSGMILNGVVVRPLTKTGTGLDFERHPFAYSPDLLADCEHSFVSITEDFVHSLQRGHFPQHARSFKSPCASCEYEDNCRLPRHQRALDLASDLYRNTTWNPMHD